VNVEMNFSGMRAGKKLGGIVYTTVVLHLFIRLHRIQSISILQDSDFDKKDCPL
jgi:hypothetical protein